MAEQMMQQLAGPIGIPKAEAGEVVQTNQKEESFMIAKAGNPAMPILRRVPMLMEDSRISHSQNSRGSGLSQLSRDLPCLTYRTLSAVAFKHKEIEALGVQVLAMSTDSRFIHKIWQENELSKMVQRGPFPMLTDAGGLIGRVYGVYDEEAGVDIRGRFIIDPDGIIQAMEVLSPPVGRNIAEFIRQVKAFQHVRATGEATPSGWQPGKVTLTPGPDLVGNVWKVWKPEMAFE